PTATPEPAQQLTSRVGVAPKLANIETCPISLAPEPGDVWRAVTHERTNQPFDCVVPARTRPVRGCTVWETFPLDSCAGSNAIFRTRPIGSQRAWQHYNTNSSQQIPPTPTARNASWQPSSCSLTATSGAWTTPSPLPEPIGATYSSQRASNTPTGQPVSTQNS